MAVEAQGAVVSQTGMQKAITEPNLGLLASSPLPQENTD